MSLTPGTRLGPYEIGTRLGAGGMGEIYRARDPRLGRDVAIKALPLSSIGDADRVARFQQEARILGSLNHPHIAALFGLEESGSSQFLIMELLEGGTLLERLAAGALGVRDALTIGRQIADALQAAHDRGIIHRDLKPANIAFTADGHAKVLDFGLAKTFTAGDGATAVDGATSERHRARHVRLHEPGAGARPAPRQADGYLLVRVRPLRDARRGQSLRRPRRLRHRRRDPRARAGLDAAAGADAGARALAAAALPGEGPAPPPS